MTLSIFLAKFIGIYFLIMAVVWLFFRHEFAKTLRDLITNHGVVALSGLINLLFGLAIAIAHPIFAFNWQGLITLIAYLFIISGICRIMYPQYAVKGFDWILNEGYWLILLFLLIAGLLLTYHGFMGT